MKTNKQKDEQYFAPETQISLVLSIASYLNASSMNNVTIEDLEVDDSFTF